MALSYYEMRLVLGTILATLRFSSDTGKVAPHHLRGMVLVPEDGGMLRVTEIIAGKQSKPLIEAAVAKAKETLSAEISRLEQLRQVNPSIREDEISAAKRELTEVEQHLTKAGPRLDAVRLILASTSQAQK